MDRGTRGAGAGLAGCLAALLSPEAGVRGRAEALLQSAERDAPGALVQELCAVAAAEGAAADVRQLACILLKNFVRVHWRADAPRFVPPLLGPAEKLLVKRTVTQLLGARDARLRSAVALCVATIAGWEWPREWPSVCLLYTSPSPRD